MRGILLAACVLLPIAAAQPHAIVGEVRDENDRPLAGVVVRIVGIGEDRTTSTGEFQIVLPSTVQPGDPVEVRFAPETWVLKNYFRGVVIVPRSRNHVMSLIVARRGALSLLTDAAIRKIVEDASLKAQPARAGSEAAAPQGVHEGIAARVDELGITLEKATAAIHSWTKRIQPDDAYGEGLAAFYEGDHPRAIERMNAARKAEREQLVNASIVIGKAHLAMFNYRAAAEAFGEAVRQDPSRAEALLGRRAACLTPAFFEQLQVAQAERPDCPEDAVAATAAAVTAAQSAIPHDDLLEANALAFRAVFVRNDPAGRQQVVRSLTALHERLRHAVGSAPARALLMAADAAEPLLNMTSLARSMREDAVRIAGANSVERAVGLWMRAAQVERERRIRAEWLPLAREAADLCAALSPVTECAGALAFAGTGLMRERDVKHAREYFDLALRHAGARGDPTAVVMANLAYARALVDELSIWNGETTSRTGAMDEALDLADRALELSRARIPHPNVFVRLLVHGPVLGVYSTAARAYSSWGLLAEAERCHRRLIERLETAGASQALAGALEMFVRWLDGHDRQDESAPHRARAEALRKRPPQDPREMR